jgi:hypothetical protein
MKLSRDEDSRDEGDEGDTDFFATMNADKRG